MSLSKLSGSQQLVTGLTAVGSSQTTALQLAGRNSLQEITTVGSSTGVMLPALTELPAQVTICNQGSNALSVYPEVGGTIDNGITNAAAMLGAGKAATFEASNLTNWYTVATTNAGGGTVNSVAAGTGLAGGTITTTGTLSLAAIADKSVLGNTSGGTAAPAGVTLSAMIDEAIGNTRGDILYRGASTWSVLAPGSSGNVLTSGGASGNPSWSSAASGTVTSVTFTGDGIVLSATPSSAVTTSGTLTAALAAQSANVILAGPTTGSAHVPTFRALTGADLPNPGASSLGGVESYAAVSHQWINAISTSGVPSSTQPAFTDISGQATLAQLPSIGTLTILANTTGGSAVPAADTLTSIIDSCIGSTQGNILYRGASSWSVLAPGTSGQVLQTGGASANPSWTNATGGGTVTSVTFTGDGTVLSATPSSAVTTTGTLTAALAAQSANVILAGPATGSAHVPTFRALTGADLPNPGASSLGGVESYAAVSHQWINAISTSGVPSSTQPAFTDISGQATLAQLPSIGTLTILANTTGGSAVPAADTLTSIIDSCIGSTQGNILYRGASSWSVLAPGTSGQVLQTGGASANPSWTNATGGGTVTSVTFTGDGTVLSSTPSSAVATSGTLTAALATQSANVILAGPASGSAQVPTFRALTGADLPNPGASSLGGVESYAAVSHQWINAISTSGVPSSTQPAFTDISGQATLAQLPSIGTLTVLANTTGGSAVPAADTLTAIIDSCIGSTQGDVLYRGASAWSVLAPGTSGQFLQTGGASANPSWANAAAGGTVTSVTFTGDGTVLSSTPSSAVTTTGTVAASLVNQSANVVLAGPASGSAAAPTFRALGAADVIAANNSFYFGSGQDSAATISSGTTTLTRDMYYTNLTLSGTGVLKPAGFRVFVSGTLDISGAQAGAIVFNGGAGSNATSATGAAAGATSYGSNTTLQTAAGGTNSGGSGSTTNGGGGGNPNVGLLWNVQFSAQAGAGGAGTGGTGGATGSGTGPNQASYPYRYVTDFKSPVAVNNGQSGAGGGAGGGDSTNPGGGGGGGGGAGGPLWIAAATIARGTNSTVGIIQSKGGVGGNGYTPTAGNCGGGGGGAGGQGGPVVIYYGAVTGSTITDAIDVTGGAGGTGGSLVGSGSANGNGGGGGPGGYVLVTNLATNTLTQTNGPARTNAASGGTTTGSSATTSQANL